MTSLSVIFLFIISVYCVNSAVYSSFYLPLVDPRILGYRVDAKFDPDAGRKARADYERENGLRGEKLIARLGTGVGLADSGRDFKVYDAVNLIYTYSGPGAAQKNDQTLY